MTKTAVFLGVLALCGVACRALVGIDDLQLAPPDAGDRRDSGDGHQNGNGDGGGHPQFLGDQEKAFNDCQGQGNSCRSCCKRSFTALHVQFEESGGRGHECMCKDDVCGIRCKGTGQACSGIVLPPVNDAGPDSCVMCFDDALSKPTNEAPCSDGCDNDQSCQVGLYCLQQCPPPQP